MEEHTGHYLMTSAEMEDQIERALSERHFCAYYQPQYNHSTGRLVGAEALVRWIHPEYGLQMPGSFIPLFENDGYITRIDLYIFEEICAFLRKCIDEDLKTVPISINVSRYDLYTEDFVESMEKIRTKYGIPVRLLRVEITESVKLSENIFINDIVDKFHSHGYLVAMDDFGSGYSSLNALKDIDVDILKLDMEFLSGEIGGRGGIIISSIVRMAHWLGTPLIAEGVETIEQADYMKSIGCDYVQGYLYAKPIPTEDFYRMLQCGKISHTLPMMKLIENLDAEKFWNPNSLETMVFNNFVGGAAIISYTDGELEVLRVNEKYLSEFGMNLSQKEIILRSPNLNLDSENKKIYLDTIKRAIVSGETEECSTWRKVQSPCCGEDVFYIKSAMRVIGRTNSSCLLYVLVNNITSEKLSLDALSESEKKYRMAGEQANIYCWEYNLDTKDMRPCARCIRDLHLPKVVKNYPEPLIESGFIPPEYADFYRGWLKKLEGGAESLEAIIPLTADRIPFHVRYTTEFDENGHPYKAYASATLAINLDIRRALDESCKNMAQDPG